MQLSELTNLSKTMFLNKNETATNMVANQPKISILI